MGACADPRCPPGYFQEGDTCRRCKVVEGSNGRVCIVGDAAALAVGSDAASDSDESDAAAGNEGRDAAINAAMDGSNPGGGEATDGGMGDGSEAGPSSDGMTATRCSSDPCQHGGACSESGDQYSCDCTDTGYQGARCESDVDECSGANVCSGTSAEGIAFSFPCLNEAPYYRCGGQFPDWPIADPPNRFSQGFRVVDDAKTGLQWEHPAGTQGYSWEDATTYCAEKGGNWRLPTKAELESLIDDTRSRPSIDPVFSDTLPESYWSATPLAGLSASELAGVQVAWIVSFANGISIQTHSFNGAYARCVRQRQ
jgi:hypothetical protein